MGWVSVSKKRLVDRAIRRKSAGKRDLKKAVVAGFAAIALAVTLAMLVIAGVELQIWRSTGTGAARSADPVPFTVHWARRMGVFGAEVPGHATSGTVRDIGPVQFPDVPQTSEDTEARDSFNFVLLLGVMISCYLFAYALREAQFPYLHESGGAILIGMLVGGLIRYLGELDRLQNVVSFNSTLFFLFLLPPIIFEAGFGLSRSTFFHNFYSITMYAVVGTLVVAFSFGLIVYVACLTPLVKEEAQLSLIECMLYGSMVSATDPVTTLAIFTQLRVPKVLYANVFGESVFNDAVAIVLYRTVSIFRTQPLAASTFLLAGVQFFVIFLGSIVLGVLAGFLVAVLFRLTEFRRHPNFEVTMLLLVAYLSYLVAEGLGLSGIVAILFAGIVMSQYATLNMSERAHEGSEFVFHVLASTAEMFVFAYIGLSVFSLEDQLYDFALIGVSVVALFLTRVFNVFPLTFVINQYRRIFQPEGHEPISWRIQLVMYWAGLRGAIAFSLSLDIDTPGGDYVRSSTLFLVLATIILVGGTTYPLLRALQIPLGEPWTADEPIPKVWRTLDSYFMRKVFSSSQFEMEDLAALRERHAIDDMDHETGDHDFDRDDHDHDDLDELSLDASMLRHHESSPTPAAQMDHFDNISTSNVYDNQRDAAYIRASDSTADE